MKKILPHILIVFFVLFSLWPTGYEWSRRKTVKPIRYFELVHNFYTDYNFYLSRIRQGREGARLVHEKYTSEPHKGSLVHILYLAIGWAADFTRTPWPRSGDAYQMARIVLSVTTVALIWSFVRRMTVGFWWQIVSFLLALTASTWPIVVFHNGGYRLGGYMPWWSVMDSLQRITFVPHMLAGQSLMLFLVPALCSAAILGRPGNWIFLGLLGLALGLVFPAGLVFVYAAVAILTVLEFFVFESRGRRKAWCARVLWPRTLFVLLSVFSIIYMREIMAVYPWKRVVDYALLGVTPFNLVEYVKAVGPVLPFGLLGLVLGFARREANVLPAVSWVLAWMGLILVFRHIPAESPLRFTEMLPHVGLSVLSVYGFSSLFSRSRNVFVKSIWISVPFVSIVVGLWVMYSSLLWQKDFIDHKLRSDYPLVPGGSYVMYPLKDFVDAMIFIQDHTSRSTVILSGKTAGNYLPVYSGNTVYIGHAATVDAEEKEQLVSEFFSGRIGKEEAREWMAKEHLSWVFFGPQEKEMGTVASLDTVYPFLTKMYTGPYVTVFKAQ